MQTIVTVLGTRPEIIKLSPLIPLLQKQFRHVLVHSGQHYSEQLDAVFFRELALPQPNYLLHTGSAHHGEQTARILSRLEPILLAERPDMLLVQGDTNTTLAGALAAAKQNIPVVHLEAGGRSFNRRMPEEVNRVLVDHMSELLLAADELAGRNLLKEGLDGNRIRVIGSTAIDAVQRGMQLAKDSQIVAQLGLNPRNYLVLTMHRAENTAPACLPGLLQTINTLAESQTIVFPMHPRTAVALQQQALQLSAKIRVLEPLGYLDMLSLTSNAQALLTDSGGLQEEAGVLGTPTLLLRNETEWQYLVQAGAQVLLGNQFPEVLEQAQHWLHPARLEQLRHSRPHIRSGAASRAAAAILAHFDTGEPDADALVSYATRSVFRRACN